jgi:tetratricopeptide (TPR) repeat protein
MNRWTPFQPQLFAALAILSIHGTSGFALSAASAHEEKTIQATDLFKEGKVKEAIELEKKELEDDSTDWLPHATMSYFRWYTGDQPTAISEAKLAAKFAPEIEALQTNLGHMALAIGDYQTAIPAFERASKIAPDDWAPGIAIVRCHRSAGRPNEALAALREMLAQRDKSFEWFYQISELCLQIDESKIADEAATKALSAAVTPEQKSTAWAQRLLALLRDSQLEQARALKDHVFTDCRPDNVELYLRCALTLLPADDPVAGKKLLAVASENIKGKLNSSAFYRLGSIFEDKAREIAHDKSKHDAWSNNAEKAYRLALALAPEQAVYHLALAGILNQQGMTGELSEELNKAQTLDKYDPLAPFLLSRLSCSEESASAQVPARPSSGQPIAVNLTKVIFKINGLNCACKLPKLRMILTKNKNVAFVATLTKKPYRGVLLIDESKANVDEVLSQCAQQTSAAETTVSLPADTAATAAAAPPAITLEVESRQPALNAKDAIREELIAKIGELRAFPIKPQQPFSLVVPITLNHRAGENVR